MDMYLIEEFISDYDDGGNSNWKPIYYSKNHIENSKVINLCIEYIKEIFLKYDGNECRESFVINKIETTQVGNIRITFSAGRKDYDYDHCCLTFRFKKYEIDSKGFIEGGW